ncbi:hypothetical protein [Paenibacillus radicis (ex Xue et al. 2023)]|uniref:Lipoprotein n=1 Tax=Paenibacillus radicis (ex Xue et al. 2023) TaxID=2972489 RepID=A0ABT1YQ21_9BACL|nr:hypothetical protein [Paenibacillus radicis (ex Xue et al. 2023)]MCR8634454.1 hypothetical protein [Paenibacillus radicis (ex Xue et al. 2023)]
MKRINKAASAVILLLLCCSFLTGCMYPKEMRKENQAATGEFVVVVQNAVDQFHAKTGVLPIKNSTESTPIFEKYPIDFKKLKERAFISNVPVNAFENGGTAIYVLVDPETKPAVKMMDLVSYQQAVEAQKLVDEFKSKNAGALPKGEVVAPSFTRIDFEKMNKKPIQVQSMYTRQVILPFIMNESGEVAIDYSEELMRLIDKKSLQNSLDAKQDLRELLVKESFYIPARSFAYRWKNGQPTPDNKE